MVFLPDAGVADSAAADVDGRGSLDDAVFIKGLPVTCSVSCGEYCIKSSSPDEAL